MLIAAPFGRGAPFCVFYGKNMSFTFNDEGIRTSKTVDGPFDMIKYPETTHGNYFSIFDFAVKENMDVVLTFSQSVQLGAGGLMSIGFNISEYFRRLFDL